MEKSNSTNEMERLALQRAAEGKSLTKIINELRGIGADAPTAKAIAKQATGNTQRKSKKGILAGGISFLVLFIPTIIDIYVLCNCLIKYGTDYITDWDFIIILGLIACGIPAVFSFFFGKSIASGSKSRIILTSFVGLFILVLQIFVTGFFYLAVFGLP